MAAPHEAILSRVDWKRIQTLLNQPKVKVYTRQEVVEKNALLQFSRAENKLNKATLRKQHAAKTLERQAKEEYQNKIAAEEAQLKKQEQQQVVERANVMMFHQSGCVRKFNRVLQTTHVQKENEALVKFNREKQRIVRAQKRKSEEETLVGQEEALREEQEKVHQKQLFDQAVAVYQTKQMKERQQLRENEMQQEKEERERLRYLDELYAQEQRTLAQKQVESKRNYLERQLGDISSRNLQRETEAQKLNTEENERKHVQFDLEENLQQRKNEQAEKFRKRQIPIKIATEKLAVTMKEQAAAKARKEEVKFLKEVAEQDAEVAKQQREKEEKKAAMIKSIAAHREVTIQEKKEKEEAEQKSKLNWFQAQRESDRLFLEKQKQKAQRTIENESECQQTNDTMMAEKRAIAERLKREECDSAVKSEEQAADRRKQLQHYIQCELHKAAESQRNVPLLLAARTGGHGFLIDSEDPRYFCVNTGNPMPRLATDQTRFIKQRLERSSLQFGTVDMKSSCLPLLFTAAKLNFTAWRGPATMLKVSTSHCPVLVHSKLGPPGSTRNTTSWSHLELTHLPPITD